MDHIDPAAFVASHHPAAIDREQSPQPRSHCPLASLRASPGGHAARRGRATEHRSPSASLCLAPPWGWQHPRRREATAARATDRLAPAGAFAPRLLHGATLLLGLRAPSRGPRHRGRPPSSRPHRLARATARPAPVGASAPRL
uniref:Uncharacterized protein n=1 Tax=Arundo donax TaxID=35708 RepID=A0A0A9EK31_ARUDO